MGPQSTCHAPDRGASSWGIPHPLELTSVILYSPITLSFSGVMAERGVMAESVIESVMRGSVQCEKKTVLIAELIEYALLTRTLSRARLRRAVRTTHGRRYTHDPTVTTRRRGGAHITRRCRHRPSEGGGVEFIREKA